jgi:5'-nucleotidase (lipoprotein e(P4) family)
MNADIIGLMEIENDGFGPKSAIQDLTNGLNQKIGNGTFNFIIPEVPQIGSDSISVGLIYNPSKVMPVGNAAILDSSVDPDFIDTKNRPSLAQTFKVIQGGSKITVAVNHFKSKGSSCDSIGDPNQNDGQGNCNKTRTKAAKALVKWLSTDPTGSGSSDILIIGDLNSYAMEDPIDAIKDGGYTNLVDQFLGENAYTYIFKGEAGYLDHALSSQSLTPKITGVTVWHINSDEPKVLDYNTENKSSTQINKLFGKNPFRASDHDPVIIGIDMGAPVITEILNNTFYSTLWVQTSTEYKAVTHQIYRTATNFLDEALADQNWTAALEQESDFSTLQPAIVLDVDETVLDNSPFQGQIILENSSYTKEKWDSWVAKASADAVPGSLKFIKAAKEKGIEIIYITNRECIPRVDSRSPCPQEQDTINNLEDIGFPKIDDKKLMLLKREKSEWASEKKSRREEVAKDYRILMLIGDDLGDFLQDVKKDITPDERFELFKQHNDKWGNKWFMLPNPVYGSWERVLSDPKAQYIKGF